MVDCYLILRCQNATDSNLLRANICLAIYNLNSSITNDNLAVLSKDIVRLPMKLKAKFAQKTYCYLS